MKIRNVFWMSFITFFAFALSAVAAPNQLTYQGRIIRSSGQPLEHNAVAFTFELTSPNGSCVIYREQKSGIDMTNSGGVFDVSIGSGSRQFPTLGTGVVTDFFDNSKVYSCANPDNTDSGATYTAASGDGRKLRVRFWDGSGWQLISPDNEVRSVPYASYSLTAENIGSIPASNVAKKTDLPTANCSAGEVLTFTSGAFFCVPDQLGTTGGGITSLSGQTGSSQSLSVQTSGTTLGWNSASNVHSLNIPLAATSGVTAGLLSNADYLSFAGKQEALGFTPLSPANNLSDLSNAATARQNLGLSTAGGDLTGSLPNPTIAKLQSKDITLSTLANKNVLFYDGAKWINKQLAVADINGLDLSSYVGFASLPTNCSSSKTLVFVSPANTFTCSDISIASTQVSGLAASATTDATNANNITSGTLDTARLPSSVTDALWSASSGSVYRNSGSVGIGTTSPDASALLDMTSTSKGFLPPRMTTANRDAILTPTAGLVIYNVSENALQIYNGGSWQNVGGSSGTIVLDSGTLSGSVEITKTFNYAQDFVVVFSGYYHGANFPMISLLADGVVCAADRSYVELGLQYGSASCTKSFAAGSHTIKSIYTETAGNNHMQTHSMNYIVFAKGDSTPSAQWSADGTSISYSGGNVGIGTAAPAVKLDVSGGVKMADSGTCDASKEGTQQYNATYKIMQYCDGTKWLDLGWRTVSLSDTSDFNTGCTYRAFTTSPNSSIIHPVATLTNRMVFKHSNGLGHLGAIHKSTKSRFDIVVDGDISNVVTANVMTISKMQMRCD